MTIAHELTSRLMSANHTKAVEALRGLRRHGPAPNEIATPVVKRIATIGPVRDMYGREVFAIHRSDTGPQSQSPNTPSPNHN